MYAAFGLSQIHALDAKTGKFLWEYDSKTGAIAGDKLRFVWGIRGMTTANGKAFIGAIDGRLIALDSKTGKELWSARTAEANDGRYISGAPRTFKDKVIIGHGGADVAPVRGYVTAYNQDTGKQVWRFFIVPGNPADGFESEAMEMAARTWKGEWWKFGGGGTAWNAMTFDQKYDRVYVGTGNGAPWNRKIRSKDEGDNLFLCSVVAVDADTGAYVWHYQTNPGETWDYNSAMDVELATLRIDGRLRDVLLHAPKNGFFYVIDRESGKLISAEPFAKVTWAERIDLSTGRPVEARGARFAMAAPSMCGQVPLARTIGFPWPSIQRQGSCICLRGIEAARTTIVRSRSTTGSFPAVRLSLRASTCSQRRCRQMKGQTLSGSSLAIR